MHITWHSPKMNWNYCPDCGFPTDPLKAFKKFSLLKSEQTIATDNTLSPTKNQDIEQTAEEEFKKHFDKFRHGLFRASLDHYLETGNMMYILPIAIGVIGIMIVKK